MLQPSHTAPDTVARWPATRLERASNARNEVPRGPQTTKVSGPATTLAAGVGRGRTGDVRPLQTT